jgi:hypothetical protein
VRGGARPGAGRKRTRPLTLSEIGKKIEALSIPSCVTEVRGRFLWICTSAGVGRNYTRQAAEARLFMLQRRPIAKLSHAMHFGMSAIKLQSLLDTQCLPKA